MLRCRLSTVDTCRCFISFSAAFGLVSKACQCCILREMIVQSHLRLLFRITDFATCPLTSEAATKPNPQSATRPGRERSEQRLSSIRGIAPLELDLGCRTRKDVLAFMGSHICDLRSLSPSLAIRQCRGSSHQPLCTFPSITLKGFARNSI